MSSRLFPTCCGIHEWLYHVSWRSVPSLLKYTSGVKIRGLQSVQPCWQTTPNTYLMQRGKLFFFIFSTVMRLSYTPPPSIYNSTLCHLSSSRLGSDRGRLSVTTLLACLICLLSLWLTGYMNISMCCSEQSGSGPPPSSVQAEADLTVDVPGPVRKKDWAGGWQCELLFRGAPGMMEFGFGSIPDVLLQDCHSCFVEWLICFLNSSTLIHLLCSVELFETSALLIQLKEGMMAPSAG